ncbi:dTDP-glucose 4,6-dehydratase [Candidatus Falkowbacteria bacterium]|nr:dTDP-glucose 4,6-dehydratase [Candidatus Falkowbacteria bacterium]
MKLLITGGAGFIGSNFIHYILEKYPDYEVVNLDKLTYAGNLDNLKDIEDDARYKFVKGDIADEKVVGEVVKGVDAIVNFAAESHVDRSLYDPGSFIKTDVYGTWVLLEAVKKFGIKKYLQVSTDEVYGDIETGFSKESDYLNPSSPYSASKAGGDMQVLASRRTFDLPVLITRSTNNYGPFHYPEKIIPLFITNCLEDKELPVYDGGTQIRDWLYVLDNCRGIDTVLHKGTLGEIYNIGANQEPEITNLELTKTILKLTGKDESLMKHVTGLRPGHDQRYAVDCSKIKALGWKSEVSFEEGIKKTVLWFKNNEEWWKKIKNGEYLEYYKKHYKS